MEGDFSMEQQENMMVILHHQGFIEGDQILAMGSMSVNRMQCRRRGRQDLLQCTYSTNPEKMKHFTTFLSIKEPIIISVKETC